MEAELEVSVHAPCNVETETQAGQMFAQMTAAELGLSPWASASLSIN